MIQTKINELEQIIDEEIQEYKEIEALYKDKREVLIQSRANDLKDIDEQILSRLERLKISAKRKHSVSKHFGKETISLSEIIEKTKAHNLQQAQRFLQKQEELGGIERSLSRLDKTNQALLKHGMVLVDKTMKIIVNACIPTQDNYNNKGKNQNQEHLQISSIIEEA